MAGEQIPGAVTFDAPATPVQASVPGAVTFDAPATPATVPQETIGAPQSTLGQTASIARDIGHAAVNSKFPYVHPIDAANKVVGAAEAITSPMENYTQEGRAEHPVLSRIGDLTSGVKELLTGGQSAGKPLGTSGGAADLATALGGVPDAVELADTAPARLSQALDDIKAARSARQAAAAAKQAQSAAVSGTRRATPIDPMQLEYRDPAPAPVNPPVRVASPLDHATINSIPGGKDLTPEAVKTLQQHIGGAPGEEIEVGSSKKNTLLKAVEPVQQIIKDTGIKMNDLIQKAPEFKSSIKDDATFDEIIDEVRDNLPGGDEEKLNAAIDKEIQSADGALESKDPREVLAYRRKLGSQIDWNDIPRNPETPAQVQNVTKVKLYRALGDKIHQEVAGSADLDKIFQPNLELQSHLDAKLGRAVSRDPVEANAIHQSELQKGKTIVENEVHDAVVKKNRELAGMSTDRVSPSIKATPGSVSPVDVAVDDAIKQFKVPASEEGALRRLLTPKTEKKLLKIKTDWVGALNDFDHMTPEERAARFSDPASVRNTIVPKAEKQRRLGLAVKTAIGLGGVGVAGEIAAHAILK